MAFVAGTHSLSRSFLLSLVLMVASGCSHHPAEKKYELEGRVVAVDAAMRQLTIAHQDIPGLMKGMTMPFVVGEADKGVFQAIAPGDEIHATLVLKDHAELQEISFTRGSNDSSESTSQVRIPQPGDIAPDITLVNQDAREIRLSQFRGEPLLLTFIYTACPFPDFCPRTSSNFRQVLQQLQKEPSVFDRAHLLSISIDPENDTPKILREYGKRYTEDLDPKFVHWQFVSGGKQQIGEAAAFFGLSYNQKDGQIVHGLRTVLLDKQGRVAKVYSGNDWKAADVARDFTSAAGQ